MESKSETSDDLSVVADRASGVKGTWMHGDGSVVTSTTLKAIIVRCWFLCIVGHASVAVRCPCRCRYVISATLSVCHVSLCFTDRLLKLADTDSHAPCFLSFTVCAATQVPTASSRPSPRH